MSVIRRYRSAFLGAAVLASTVSCLVAAFAGVIAAAAVAAVAAILVLATLGAERLERASPREALIDTLVAQASAGRKSAMYDRDTGLFAYWYMTLRGEEECIRSARYERPLTLLVIEPAPEADAWTVQGSIALWLRQHMRAIDIAGYLGNARFVIMMPETGVDAAQNALARLRSEFNEAQVGFSILPADGGTFEQLYAAAQERLSKAVEQAA